MSAADWIRARLRVVSESGNEITAECPFCGKPKLWANPGKGVFICYYGCDQGSIARLISAVDGVPLSRARERLAGEAPRSVGELRDRFDRFHPDHEIVIVDQPLPHEFRPCFDGRRYHVPAYVEEPLPDGRQLDDRALRLHGLGFAESGRYRDRLIVPIHCAGNRTFQARLMGDPRDFAWKDRTTGRIVEPARYLAPKGANIGRFLYWYDHAPRRADLVIVEGVFDAIRLIGLGVHAIATFGKRVTGEQLALLARLEPRSIVVLYDAGARSDAVTDAWKIRHQIGRKARRVAVGSLPGKHDPDSFGAAHGRRGVREILKAATPVKDRLCSLREALAELSSA